MIRENAQISLKKDQAQYAMRYSKHDCGSAAATGSGSATATGFASGTGAAKAMDMRARTARKFIAVWSAEKVQKLSFRCLVGFSYLTGELSLS